MLRFIILTALYVLAAWYAEAFIRAPGQVTLFWPAAGIAYTAVLRYGARSVWFVPVAMLLTHLTLIPDVPTSFIPFSMASNTLGALAALHFSGIRDPESRLSVTAGFRMLRGALVLALVSAVIGSLGMRWSGMITAVEFWPAFAKWGMSDLLGIICVSPAMLILTAPSSSNPDLPGVRDYSGRREKIAWLLAMATATAAFYWGGTQNSLYALGMLALPMSLLLWSAIRFEPDWTVLGTAVTVLVLTSLTGLGLTGFRPPDDALDSALFLGFMCLFATIPLVLMASIHELRIATRKVIRRATTDAATGLPNRAAFEERTRRLLESKNPPRTLAYVDLDHFTLVNDTASHAAGDALLVAISGVLKTRAHENDQLFRLGGDEFAMLLDVPPYQSEARMQDLLRAVESYRLGWEGLMLNTTASIGLSALVPGETDFAQALSQADAACFTAKELGGNRACLASLEPGEMQERAEAMRWAVRIRAAIDHGLFELDCQSITPLRGQNEPGRHFEVLVRMRDALTGKRLLPGHFIPAAERFHLGVALDRHVVELALGWLESHPEAEAQTGTCAINLTAASLVDPGFSEFLIARVRKGRVAARKLCFEITETSAVRDLARAQALITQMRGLGCRFALDDFGTGFCSFNYLRMLDVDYFKIDGSFVRELSTSPLSTAVVRSITDIAHVLQKATIAEHTEDEAVCVTLRALGVDYAQGFGVHRPEPIESYFASPEPST